MSKDVYVKFVCGNCGKTFAIKKSALEDSVETGNRWHCPYCGSQIFALIEVMEVDFR